MGHLTASAANIVEHLTIFFGKKSNARGLPGGGGGEWAPLDLTDTKCAVETFWAMSLVGIFPSWASELSQLSRIIKLKG